LLVSAFLTDERRTLCSFFRQHAVWRSALSALCLNARIALLYGDGLFCHRLPNQPLRFFTHGLLRHFPGSSYVAVTSAFLCLDALEVRRFIDMQAAKFMADSSSMIVESISPKD